MTASAPRANAAAESSYAERVARNETVLDDYRVERTERHARGLPTRAIERVIDRLEVETALLRDWAGRDARAASR